MGLAALRHPPEDRLARDDRGNNFPARAARLREAINVSPVAARHREYLPLFFDPILAAFYFHLTKKVSLTCAHANESRNRLVEGEI